jgi:hypothetical protein
MVPIALILTCFFGFCRCDHPHLDCGDASLRADYGTLSGLSGW